MAEIIKLKATSVEELREALPSSGLFELQDCDLDIHCYAGATVEDLDLIRSIIEGAINVRDIRITASFEIEGYEIKIKEVPISIIEGKN
jgi:hypothetical protein